MLKTLEQEHMGRLGLFYTFSDRWRWLLVFSGVFHTVWILFGLLDLGLVRSTLLCLPHSSKNGTFIQKCHIHPKMAHFIQKCHIHPKMAYSFKYGTFIKKWHIYPKMAHLSKMSHLSKSVVFIQKWPFIQKRHIHPKISHSSKNFTLIPKFHIHPKRAIFQTFWKVHFCAKFLLLS